MDFGEGRWGYAHLGYTEAVSTGTREVVGLRLLVKLKVLNLHLIMKHRHISPETPSAVNLRRHADSSRAAAQSDDVSVSRRDESGGD